MLRQPFWQGENAISCTVHGGDAAATRPSAIQPPVNQLPTQPNPTQPNPNPNPTPDPTQPKTTRPHTWYVAVTPSPPSAGNMPPYAAAAATASPRVSAPRRRAASAAPSPIERRWATRPKGEG
jgi:hypothetical protein